MPMFRVSWRNVFDEVEAEHPHAAKRAVLPEFEDYGATERNLKDFTVEQICGGCFKATCDCLSADASCDPE